MLNPTSPVIWNTMLTTIPLFAVVAVMGLVIGAVTIGYFLLAQRLARLETQVKSMVRQSETDHIQKAVSDAGVETRLDIIEQNVAKLTTLLEQNVKELQDMVMTHNRKFEQYDESIWEFWKNYEIKKRQ